MKKSKSGPNKSIGRQTERDIYKSVSGICHKYSDDGFSLTDEITRAVVESLMSELQKKVYKQLTATPQKVGDIAKAIKMKSNVVSAVLLKIYDTNSLIGYKHNGTKRRLWYRNSCSLAY